MRWTKYWIKRSAFLAVVFTSFPSGDLGLGLFRADPPSTPPSLSFSSFWLIASHVFQPMELYEAGAILDHACPSICSSDRQELRHLLNFQAAEQAEEITMEGYLLKKSRIMGSWEKRYRRNNLFPSSESCVDKIAGGLIQLV